MIEGDAAGLMLKIESFVTTLAAIDCAIRWSNLFSMTTLSTKIFAGLLILQSIATLLLIIGFVLTIYELWTNRSRGARRFQTNTDLENGRQTNLRYYVLCEIPVTRKLTNQDQPINDPHKNSIRISQINPSDQKDPPRMIDPQKASNVIVCRHKKSKLQIRAKKEIWFTAACAFIDDFLVPCVFWILYEHDCNAFQASGGNSWFDIAEATVGTLAALFVWIIVGALLLRVATLLRKGECASKCPTCLRWFLCVLIGTLAMCAIGFSLLQGGGLGLFLSTSNNCPQNQTTITLPRIITHATLRP